MILITPFLLIKKTSLTRDVSIYYHKIQKKSLIAAKDYEPSYKQ
ncbi:Uncharacterised protein [Elizabethkingia meningoseptica]|nr:Uncharacterised protein [Elizabethkingia meningoseptica]